MPAFRNLAGVKFNRLEATRMTGRKGRRIMWEFKCDCGALIERVGESVISGNTKSCGCYFDDVMIKHGAYLDPVYAVWGAMLARCSNPNNSHWKRYGGRSITVCESWKTSYPRFITDMGPRPEGGKLERRNNDLGYSPENCYWATRFEQARNTSRKRMLTLNGETKPMWEWIEKTGINKNTLTKRLGLGWSDERALTTPIDKTKSHPVKPTAAPAPLD